MGKSYAVVTWAWLPTTASQILPWRSRTCADDADSENDWEDIHDNDGDMDIDYDNHDMDIDNREAAASMVGTKSQRVGGVTGGEASSSLMRSPFRGDTHSPAAKKREVRSHVSTMPTTQAVTRPTMSVMDMIRGGGLGTMPPPLPTSNSSGPFFPAPQLHAPIPTGDPVVDRMASCEWEQRFRSPH